MPSLVPSQEDLEMAEAPGGRVSLPASTQLVNQYNQGVPAVIFSDHRLAYHAVTRARTRARSEAELREVQRQLMYLLEELRANRARPTDREAVMRRWRARVE